MKLCITILKYHLRHLCQISLQIILLPILIIYKNSLFYHRNVDSFLVYFILFYFILIRVCMAEEPSIGELCNKVCMYACM